MICRNMKRTLEPAYVQPTLTAEAVRTAEDHFGVTLPAAEERPHSMFPISV